MMICPDSYMEMLKDKPYKDLIKCRDNLIRDVQRFERDEIKGDRSDPSWRMHPRPDVVYQVKLQYLSRLCAYMQEKYNAEYIWGERTLQEDGGEKELG